MHMHTSMHRALVVPDLLSWLVWNLCTNELCGLSMYILLVWITELLDGNCSQCLPHVLCYMYVTVDFSPGFKKKTQLLWLKLAVMKKHAAFPWSDIIFLFVWFLIHLVVLHYVLCSIFVRFVNCRQLGIHYRVRAKWYMCIAFVKETIVFVQTLCPYVHDY